MKLGPVLIQRATPIAEAAITIAELEADRGRASESLDLFQERIAELEFALEDINWTRLNLEGSHEFSRKAALQITQLARVNYLKNPMIRRGVDVQAFYVWAQGVNIVGRADSVNDVVQAFVEDPRNKTELTSHEAMKGKEIYLQLTGNIFFCFFTNPSSGRVRVRSLPTEQILEVLTNPQDAREPWYYKRQWIEQALVTDTGAVDTSPHTAYYPDWRYEPSAAEKVAEIGGQPVMWDTPVYHMKTGGLQDMRFGMPEVYPALDWARSLKEQLEDDVTRSRALARFAWNLTTKGGSRGVLAAKAKLGTTFGNMPQQQETNPPPLTASTFIGADGVDLKATNLSGAMLPADHTRNTKLMVISALGLPETFFGDVQKGNHATAKTLDRPTELKIRDRQTHWKDTLGEILAYVVLQAMKAPNGPMKAMEIPAEDGDGDSSWVAEELDDKTGEPISLVVDVSFPSVLEHDVDILIGAIVQAATLNRPGIAAGTIEPRVVTQQLLQTLQIDDVDEILQRMYPNDGDGEGPQAPPALPSSAGGGGTPPAGLPGQRGSADGGNPQDNTPPSATEAQQRYSEAMTAAARELAHGIREVTRKPAAPKPAPKRGAKK